MRQTLIIAAALFIGCATGAAVRDIVVPAKAQNFPGPFYEYKAADLGTSSGYGEMISTADNLMNRFAREGWRYVGGAERLMIFERPRASATNSPQPAAQ